MALNLEIKLVCISMHLLVMIPCSLDFIVNIYVANGSIFTSVLMNTWFVDNKLSSCLQLNCF